jgi:predicted phage terminase large subunit-like protein
VQAAQELLRRRRARQSLIDFVEYTFERYRTAQHHRVVAAQLERVERREIDRLMLLLPPRHGKTELASRRYPAWVLGRNPHRQVIAASASAEFASDVGREVRNVVRSEEYGRLFQTQLAEDSQAASRWHTKQGGIFYSVGVGSQILGKGADEFIIDDPFGSMADAQSEVERKAVKDWYQGSVYNRLQPGGAIIVINHRMHEDDLSGYLLEQQQAGGDKWEVVQLPAIDNTGAALWPDAYPLEALERIRANSQPRYWSALYQQDPQPDEGTFFRREWFRAYDETPKVNFFGTSDFAVTDGAGDYTEHAIWGVAVDGSIYALDWWRGQTDASVWIERWCDLVLKHKPVTWFAESGVIKRAIEGLLKKRMEERRAWVSVEWVPSINDKATRARAFQALAANGKVSFPKLPWAGDVVDQLIRFPAGKYDDAVDCCSLIGRAVYEAWPAVMTARETSRNPSDLHSRQRPASGGWKVA